MPEPEGLPAGVPPGLPHGRRWVRDHHSCTCALCSAIPDDGPPVYEAPHTEVRWVTTKRRKHRAVVGPVNVVLPGELVEVYGDGRHRKVRVAGVGRVFERDGQQLRYGYLTERPG